MIRFLGLLTVFFIASAIASDYRLGAGDEIEISVYQEDDLSMSVPVGESGSFTYPYLGSISLTGKSTSELEQEITQGLLQDVLVKPVVRVSVSRYRHFFVDGEVKSVGSYEYQPGLTVKQAVLLAGGFSEWADTDSFRIQREGSEEAIKVGSSALIAPGDTLIVREGGLF